MANPNGIGGFKPGQSGNPTGRPKSNDVIVALAQTYTAEAIETLGAIMRDETKPTAARVTAATALLDRGYGKPGQSIAITGDEKPLISVIKMVVVGANQGLTIEQEKDCLTVAEISAPPPLPP